MSENAIILHDITRCFGKRQALSGVTLTVPAGSFYALLGPNGAGKTTIFRCLMGLIQPDGGNGNVLGVAIGPSYPPISLKSRLGYVAQQPVLYESMTAHDLVGFCSELNHRWDNTVVKRYLDLFRLPADVPVRHMSAGMRAQLALTLVMGGRPELLLLDEPTLGLDPVNRHQYLQVLLADSMEVGRTVLISSHDLHQIERIADHIAILKEGRIVAASTVDDLKNSEKRVRIAGDITEQTLRAIPQVRQAVREHAGWLLYIRDFSTALADQLAALPNVTGMQVVEQSLEEIFLSYVT